MKKIISLLVAVVAMLAVSVTSFAVKSPVAPPDFDVNIGGIIDQNGNSKTDTSWIKVIKDGENLIISVEDGYEDFFIKWIITGEYEIIEGDLNSPTLVIRPLGNITIQQVVTDINAKPNTNTDTDTNTGTPGKPNESPTSPSTGTAAGVLVVLMGACACTAVISKKNLSK